jgi:hypothetical protein
MHFYCMSMWFFEDVDVDHGALAHLHDVALRTATRLQEASQRRPQIAARNLARCAGPFAEDLADHTIRLANHHRELAEALVTLAATAASAAREAQREQARREQLRLDYRATQAAEALADAAAAALTGTMTAPAASAAAMAGPWNPEAPL